MDDINVGAIAQVHNNPDNSGRNRRRAEKKDKDKERRSRKSDRRRDVRDGIVVTLSYKKERRDRVDRRKPGRQGA